MNGPPKFTNSKKPLSNNCAGEKSPNILQSPLQCQDGSPSQPTPQQFKRPQHQRSSSGYEIPGRMKPVDEIKNNNQCNSCNQKDATRLCLDCNRICCDGCALDHHDGHKKLKLHEVSDNIQIKKIKLNQNIVDLENLITAKETVSKALKIQEDEAMEKVDAFIQKISTMLQDQREIIKKEIQKELADAAAENSKQAFNKAPEAVNWIQDAKNISRDIEKNKITDNNSLLCSLYKQEECYKKIDINKLKNMNEALDKKNPSQIMIKCNNQLLEDLKGNIVKIKVKQSIANKNDQISPSREEEAKESYKEIIQQGGSQNSKKNSQESSPIKIPFNNNNINAVVLGQRDIPKSAAPIQKADNAKDLKKAFENKKLEIQVKTKKDSDIILLESISKYNANNLNNVDNGLQNDNDVKIFNETLKTKGLQEPCQRVSHLILDLFSLTEEGVLHLSGAICQLSSLQTVQLSFYMTQTLFPISLKPLFASLARLKSLKDFSLKLPVWNHLKGTNLLPLLSTISDISTLKSLSIDLSKCSKLDLPGIPDAVKYLLKHKNLEKLQISFQGCPNICDDNNALENLRQNCLSSQLKEIKLDFTECPNLSDVSIEMINDINKKKAI